jgi:hypothetical protein
MSAEDLKNTYGKGNTKSVLNRAIRAEFPGTDELIELRTWLNARPECPEKFRTCRVLDRYLRRCENAIREKFGMTQIELESKDEDTSYE